MNLAFVKQVCKKQPCLLLIIQFLSSTHSWRRPNVIFQVIITSESRTVVIQRWTCIALIPINRLHHQVFCSCQFLIHITKHASYGLTILAINGHKMKIWKTHLATVRKKCTFLSQYYTILFYHFRLKLGRKIIFNFNWIPLFNCLFLWIGCRFLRKSLFTRKSQHFKSFIFNNYQVL